MHSIPPIVLWMTGLSGAGKSTIAYALEKRLQDEGVLCEVLDGDVLRSGINSNLGFSEADRQENIRRAAEVAKLLLNNHFVVICSLITPTENLRNIARNVLGDSFRLIHISTPLDVCKERDVKGLYLKALNGDIPNFTGISAPFDTPHVTDLEINTHHQTEAQSVEVLYAFLRNLNK
jgi:adenylylsulfate kinase